MEWYLGVALVIVGAGLAALAVEFFVPTGGILAVVGVTALVVAVAVVAYYGERTEAVAAALGVCVAVPVAGYLMVAGWRRLSLESALTAAPDAEDSLGTSAMLSGLDALKGRTGRTVSPMRPAGVVDFGGRRVDALSEGPLLDADTPVRCVSARAGRVVVRALDPDAAPRDLANLPFSPT